MSDGARFPQRYLPLLFALPQLLVLPLFFYWPSLQAFCWSLHRIQPFGNGERFAGLANYVRVLNDPGVLAALRATWIFSLSATLLAMLIALLRTAAIVSLIPPILVIALMQRWFAKGLVGVNK